MSDHQKLREMIKAARERIAAPESEHWWTLTSEALQILADAAESTLPPIKTQTVEKWAVTYWSLTAKATVCKIALNSEQANQLVEMNGQTAVKHLMYVQEWLEPPT